ncbi:MAG: SUMF1/EgtB/PvdO family nonheme iron enzyme [Anaerolineae bacterium]
MDSNEPELEITYIGNAGFLIASSDDKVLVDALYRGCCGYTIPSERRTLMEQALPPFDGVDLILTTHVHADHFDPLVVGAHLENNPHAILVSTEQVVNQLRSVFPGFDDVRDRARAVQLTEGERTQATLNGIELEMLNLPHSPDADGGRPEHMGFLFSVGGVKLLHLGDSEATLSELRVYQLPDENIDVAFVPYPYLIERGNHKAVREGIQAKQIIATHLAVAGESREWICDSIEAYFPEAVVFHAEMEKWTVSAATATPTEAVTATVVPPTEASTTRTRLADGMVMVYVPGGEFEMGSAEGADAEQPVHRVTLDGFWIDQTEVTNAQYELCVETGPCQAPTTCDWGQPTYTDASKASHPVVCVHQADAQTYCEWAGARLPTEAEWEYAARGPQGYTYPWGDTPDGARLNFCDANCALDWRDANYDDGYEMTAPVGSFADGASWCGALDMAGNVGEWVADWYAADYYDRSPAHNPQGPDSGEESVHRGSSWTSFWSIARSAFRGSGSLPDARNSDVGLRCTVPGE